jgi:hypothetical protein
MTHQQVETQREAQRSPQSRAAPPRRLSSLERARLAGEILASYVHARRALRGRPIQAAVASLRARAASRGEGDVETGRSLAEVRRLGRAVARTLSPLPGDTRCLVRSLVLTRLLAARGIEATLVIAARTEPEFLAHAWVEYRDEPVLPPGDGSFARLVEL